LSSKYKRKGKSKFIMIDGYVKRCLAWQALTPVERNAYIEVKWRYDGTNNGRIGLGARELAAELGMGKSTASDALNSLQKYGFICVSKPSAFHIKNRTATEWRLTEYGCDVTGDLPSKEFMRWQPTKKQQSAPPDIQSAPPDTSDPKCRSNEGDGPLHRTVKPVLDISQSAPPATYRSTISPSELEGEVTGLGELAQRLTKSEASKLPGRRSPAQREQTKKYFSSLEERRASAREPSGKEKLLAAFDKIIAKEAGGSR
jgi:DNA-binding MarR family transcriptional regulator